MSDTRRKDKYQKSKKRFQKHHPRTKKDVGIKVDKNTNKKVDSLTLKKDKLKEIALETVEITTKTFKYLPDSSNEEINIKDDLLKAQKNTKTYFDNDLKDLIQTLELKKDCETEFEMEFESTLEGIFRIYEEKSSEISLAVLNFASAKNPGGGFLKGSMAQEESLAYVSGLFSCLKNSPVYELNRQNMREGLYHDTVIFSPSVPVFRDKEGNLMEEPIFCSFVSCPAVNTTVALQNGIPECVIEKIMKDRMDFFLAICVKHGIDCLILGSWGCGVFGNNIDYVAKNMIDLLSGKYYGAFQNVCFSVLDEEHQVVFEKYLNKFLN